jgi:uncharacterized membrane protein YhaH (DUF805 family)
VGARRGGTGWGDFAWAALALALLSPLAIFAKAGVMPLWGLFAVAGGIAVMLALVGRRLHDALLSDVLSRRAGAGRWILAMAVVLIGVFLVLVGVAVALVWIAGGGLRTTPL